MARPIQAVQVLADPSDVERRASPAEVRISRINLASVASKTGLLDLISNELGFPEYYGRNWDSLEECLRDLEGDRGWLIIFETADTLRALPQQDLATFRQILCDTAEFWRGEGRVFEVIFVGDQSLKALLECANGQAGL